MSDLKGVLLAEDESVDVFLMKRAFREAGIAQPLIVVPDGQEAIYYLAGRGQYADRKRYPEPCLVILDLKMPGLGGFEVLRWIRKRSEWREALTVVVLSSSGLEADVREAFAQGANDFLVKPAHFRELFGMIQKLKEEWLDPMREGRHWVEG